MIGSFHEDNANSVSDAFPRRRLAGVRDGFRLCHGDGRWPDVIRFGAPLPLTGGLAPEALKAQQGYEVWAEQVNKAGGIKVGDRRLKVEMVYVDYQSNTPRAVQAAEGLITQDKVDFLFSPHGSGAAKAARIVSEKYKIPTVAATASSQQVFDQKPRYLFGTYTVMAGHLGVGAVEAGIVAVGIGDGGLEIVADHELWHPAQETEQIAMQAVKSHRTPTPFRVR